MSESTADDITESLIDILDAGLEFNKRRATINALNGFVQHLTGRPVSVQTIQRFCALNPKDYTLSWEVRDALVPASGDLAIVKYGGFVFSLEVRAKGKKDTRIRKAKAALKKGISDPLSLPELPILDADNNIVERVSCSSSEVHATKVKSETKAFNPREGLAELLKEPFYSDQLIFQKELPSKPGRFATTVDFLAPRVRDALSTKWGVTRLYSHQVEAISASLKGSDVLLLTGTGSGKTLCFSSVILQKFTKHRGLDGDISQTGGGFLAPVASDSGTTALFIYPTKALTQDQLRALTLLFKDEHIRIRSVDGDSTPSEREDARLDTDVLLTNPDFLHTTILSNHTHWRRFLSKLDLIVIDEGHVYNGAFGCHFSLVLRRLTRLLPKAPTYFVCSATISNPEETFSKLTGRKCDERSLGQLVVVAEDASPQGSRLIALWRPSLIKGRNDNKRYSAIFETAKLLSALVRNGVRTLAFCKTRKLVELTLKYTHELLKGDYQHLRTKLMAYRAGYTKAERREIEQKMFRGELLGICCTSALELGIDIGECEAVIVLGFAGAASTMQMFGRAGRKGREALNLVVAFDGLLDRTVIANPEKFFARKSEESAVFDPLNEIILKKHLLCAAQENPLDFSSGLDMQLFGEDIGREYIKQMMEDDLLIEMDTDAFRINAKVSRPHNFSLRNVETTHIKLVCDATKELLDEIEYSRAFFELYPGAIYMHQNRTYCVVHLDLKMNHIARATRVDVDYYTSPSDSLDVCITKIFESRGNGVLSTGVVRLTWNVTGFVKRRFGFEDFDSKKFGKADKHPVSLPQLEYSTRATWLQLPIAHHTGAIHAAQHLLCKALGVLISSHHSSISTIHTANLVDRLLIFDQDPGGIGIADAAYSRIKECITVALETLSTCPCSNGCAECLLDPTCVEFNHDCEYKEGTLTVLQSALSAIANIEDQEVQGADTTSQLQLTPRRIRRVKSLARERASGTSVVSMWKRHLPELGSEAVEFESEL